MHTLSGKEFQIGLTMSGAISAGAYTAGVFDFLIQALDEWEKARNGEVPGVDPAKIPNHRVGVKVMSGASAGAITAAIGAVALADGDQKPVPFHTHGEGKQATEYYLPKLYYTWVVKPCLVADDVETSDFLKTTDIDPPPQPAAFTPGANASGTPAAAPKGETRPVVSLLNSRLLDEAAAAAIDITAVAAPRPYISTTLHIYMTLTNLRGVPYKVCFEGDDYEMISHGDRVHYALTGLGTWNSPSEFADSDAKREIDAATLAGDPAAKSFWKNYTICALASAAFPVGLAPREIDSKCGEFTRRRFPIDGLVTRTDIVPDWPASTTPDSAFRFTTVDGGVIDNDPFEFARFALKAAGKLELPNEPDLAKADRAVIMVSPFPKHPSNTPEGKAELDIVTIVKSLLPALLDQARFKPTELVLAADPAVGSRYLIEPRRITNDNKAQPYPIASGLLGGFGGFVARAFRAHDFQLGRRNCQQFLRQVFTLPPDHEIIKNWPDEAKSSADFKAEPAPSMPEGYAIIPLLGSAAAEVVLPEWALFAQRRFDELQGRIAQRFDSVAPALLARHVKGLLQFLLGFALRPPQRVGIGLIRNKALQYIKLTILSDLVRRDQIEGWELPRTADLDDHQVRLVLAELLNPAFDQRNVQGLAKATGLSPPSIEALLQSFLAAKGKPFEVWKAPWKGAGESDLYALAIRKPPWPTQIIGRLFGAEALAAVFLKQKADPSSAGD